MLSWVLVGEGSNIALNLVSGKGVEWCFVCSQKFTYSHSRVNRCIFMVEQLFCQITHFWSFFLWTDTSITSNVLAFFTDNDSSVLEAEFLHFNHIYIPFALQMSHALVPLSEVPSLLNLENHSKTCVLPVFYSPKRLQMFLKLP